MSNYEVDGIRSLSATFNKSLASMAEVFQAFSELVPKPTKVNFRGGLVYRYKEKSIKQAIILKAARYQSGLSAATILLRFGFLQELASIQRILDEHHEDIVFLAYALIFEDKTKDHCRFLDSFYEEEVFDDGEGVIRKKRATLPRKKIQSYLAEKEAPEACRERARLVSTTVSAVYSGYVHGAASHIFESYFGSPPMFHLTGQRDSPFFDDHDRDLWNQYYRGWIHLILSSNALGARELSDRARASLEDFKKETGRSS